MHYFRTRSRLRVISLLFLAMVFTACGESTPTANTIASTVTTNSTSVANTATTTNPPTATVTTADSTKTVSVSTPDNANTNSDLKPSPVITNEEFAYGVASGDMTNDGVVLWTRTSNATDVTPQISESSSFDNPLTLPPVSTTSATDFTTKVTVKGLKAGTKYFYRFASGNNVSPVGSFNTAFAPDQNTKVTMAFTGDADWKWKPYPLLNSLNQEKLDYFFFLGDLLYETTDLSGNTVAEDLNSYRQKYRENREPRPGSNSKMVPMLDLYRLFGQYSVFDNHETGLSKSDKNAPPYNEGGAQVNGQYVNQSEGFKQRLEAYREYQPVSDELVSGTGDKRTDQTFKFYRTVQWGANSELMILDDRSYRDVRLGSSDDPAAAACSRTMLGAPQLKWFEDELMLAKQHNITWKVVVVSSPIQELGRASQIGSDMDGTKSWAGGYNCERNKILKFIDDNAIDNVVFLTTDNHYTIVNNLKYNTVVDNVTSPQKSARNAIEILTGPIGASAGTPAVKVNTQGLSIRDADRKILATWNGDIPNSQGQMKGLKQAGLDPIGLEAGFPGLDVSSIKATGSTPGSVEPLDFASFNTYSYAVLTFDHNSLSVKVKGLPIVPDPVILNIPQKEKDYENSTAHEIFSFMIKAQ